MTHDKQRPSPQQTLTMTPASQPAVAERTNALGLLESGITSVVPDIGADDWVEAARKMGSAGTVVLDALPPEMALPRVEELWDLAYVREWVYGLEPAAVVEAAPGLALKMIDDLWPVGVALGMDAALNVVGELGELTAENNSRGLTEVMRDGAETSVASAALTGQLTYSADVAGPLDSLDVVPSIAGAVAFRWDAPIASSVTELLQLLWGSIAGSTPATDAVAARVHDALAKVQPVWSVQPCAAMDVTTDATQVAEDLPGGLAFPLEGLVRMMGDVQVGSEGGVRIEGDADGMRAVVQLTNAAQADGLLGFLLGLDVPDSVAGEVVFDLSTGQPRFLFAAIERGEDRLEFRTAQALADWLGSLVMGGGAASTMAEALRASGLCGLSRSVRRQLSWSSALIPDGLLTGVAMAGEPELVLEARVDAERLAQAFERSPYPVDMQTLRLTPEDGLRAALDVVRGQRPPGWWTLTPAQLAGAVDLEAPRIQCELRAQMAEAHHVITEQGETETREKIQNFVLKPNRFTDAIATELNDATGLAAHAEVGATARMDLPVEAPSRDIWSAL